MMGHPSAAGEFSPQKSRTKNIKRVSISSILLVLIMIAGMGVFLYPTFSDYWNSFHQSRAIAGYAEAVSDINIEEYERMLYQAKAFNATLPGKSNRWKLNQREKEIYNKILNVSGTGIIGYIEIPAIKVDLPIYHGTDEAVLEIAIGHIEGSSFPVGGKGTHSVLSGHRGHPSAKLFTNLDKLTEGDVFVIRVLDETFTYMIDQILIVEPEDISALAFDPKKDYCTLVTCTPYGINSHRMLVRGHRIANLEGPNAIMVTSDAQQIDRNITALFIGTPVIILFFIRDMATAGKKRRKRIARWEAIDKRLNGI